MRLSLEFGSGEEGVIGTEVCERDEGYTRVFLRFGFFFVDFRKDFEIEFFFFIKKWSLGVGFFINLLFEVCC